MKNFGLIKYQANFAIHFQTLYSMGKVILRKGKFNKEVNNKKMPLRGHMCMGDELFPAAAEC